MVKLKYHLHITFREAPVVPAHIVVPWPHAVDLAVEKIIQTPGAICQLAKALCQSGERTGGVIQKIKKLDEFIHSSDVRFRKEWLTSQLQGKWTKKKVNKITIRIVVYNFQQYKSDLSAVAPSYTVSLK